MADPFEVLLGPQGAGKESKFSIEAAKDASSSSRIDRQSDWRPPVLDANSFSRLQLPVSFTITDAAGAKAAAKTAAKAADNLPQFPQFQQAQFKKDNPPTPAPQVPDAPAQPDQGPKRGPNGRLPVGVQPGDKPYVTPVPLPDAQKQPPANPAEPLDWQKHAAEGQKKLDDLAAKNKKDIQKTVTDFAKGAGGNKDSDAEGVAGGTKGGESKSGGAGGTNGGPLDKSGGVRDTAHVPQIGVLGVPIAAVASGAYGQWGHPALQRTLIPMQLAADTLAAEGRLTQAQAIIGAPRKFYLDYLSSNYGAQVELSRVVAEETAVRRNLSTLKAVTEENLEALKLKGDRAAKIAQLEKLAQSPAASSETAVASKLESAYAGMPASERAAKIARQIQFLKSESNLAASVVTQNATLKFLTDNEHFLAGKVNQNPLNWTAMSQEMKNARQFGAPLFAEGSLKPVADLAAKEKPFFTIGGQKVARAELEAMAKSLERDDRGFRKYNGSLMGKILVPAAIVGTDSWLKTQAAMTLAENGNPTLARIAMPNLPGAVAKTSALLLPPALTTKGAFYVGAHLYEAETNMTSIERLETTGVGVALALVFGKKKAAAAIGAIGVAAEVTNRLLYRDDKAVEKSEAALTKITDKPNDYSDMNGSVQALIEQGKANPFLMAQNYDAAHQPGMSAKATDSPAEAKLKYKAQLIIEQAQAETILANGLTNSQWQKMRDPKAKVEEPANLQEVWRLAPTERLDIAGQATKILIRAVSNANLLEAALAKDGDSNQKSVSDIALVEKQRQQIKEKLDDILNKPHPIQLENALKKSTYGYGHAMDYNLPEMYRASGLLPGQADGKFVYAHIVDSTRATADTYAAGLKVMQGRLDGAVADYAQARAENKSSVDIAVKEKNVQMYQDALDLNRAYTAKLYRDEALMKLGVVQSAILDGRKSPTTRPGDSTWQLMRDANEQLLLANRALQNAAKHAPNNPDLAQLNVISTSMGTAIQQISPTKGGPKR